MARDPTVWPDGDEFSAEDEFVDRACTLPHRRRHNLPSMAPVPVPPPVVQTGATGMGSSTSTSASAPTSILLFSKDNVAVHTSAGPAFGASTSSTSATSRIRGRLSLVRYGAGGPVSMSWTPYFSTSPAPSPRFDARNAPSWGSRKSKTLRPSRSSGIAAGAGAGAGAGAAGAGSGGGASGSHVSVLPYTIHSVAVTEMRSVRRHTPPLGWHYIIIVLNSGLALPPLYFYDGGVREFIHALKQLALVARSIEDPNLYIINDNDDPLMRTLASLQLRDVAPLPPHPHPSRLTHARRTSSVPSAQLLASLITETDLAAAAAAGGGGGGDGGGGGAPPPLSLPQSSSSTSLVTLPGPDVATLLSSAAGQAMVVPAGAAAATAAAAAVGEAGLAHKDTVVPLPAAAAVASVSVTSPPAPVAVQDMPMQVLEQLSAITRFTRNIFSSAAYAAAGHAGEEGLLGGKDVEERMPQPQAQDHSTSLVPPRQQVPPLSNDEWLSLLDTSGCVKDFDQLKKRVFYGGLQPDLRKEVWPILTGCYPPDSTAADRTALKAAKAAEYRVLLTQWQSISGQQAKRFSKYRERCSRIDKDVIRTDRTLPFFSGEDNANLACIRRILLTYSFYNFDLGYCQGMSDILAPLLFVLEDEVITFWAFAAFMETVGANFHRDQSGMHSQLEAVSKLTQLVDPALFEYLQQVGADHFFFCFRWLLVRFKREFTYEDVPRLWESLWSCHLTPHFHIFLAVAILVRHRRRILDDQMEFDTILRFVNDLSCHIDLHSTLHDAEALLAVTGEEGMACMPALLDVQEAEMLEGPETGEEEDGE